MCTDSFTRRNLGCSSQSELCAFVRVVDILFFLLMITFSSIYFSIFLCRNRIPSVCLVCDLGRHRFQAETSAAGNEVGPDAGNTRPVFHLLDVSLVADCQGSHIIFVSCLTIVFYIFVIYPRNVFLLADCQGSQGHSGGCKEDGSTPQARQEVDCSPSPGGKWRVSGHEQRWGTG